MQRLTRNEYRAGSTVKSLITSQEEQMIEVQSHLASKGKQLINQSKTEQSLEEQDQDISIERLKQTDVEKMALLINQLIAKNKINAKNAFEIPLIHLQDTRQFKSGFGDNSWKNLSSTLENDYKIYGYRVDATHNYTYRMLQSITRQQKKDDDDDSGERKDNTSLKKQKNGLNSQFISSNIEDYYCKYLERNYRNINILHLETFFNTNPIIEKTKRIFDQQGIKGLLLNNIEINSHLELTINLGLRIPNVVHEDTVPNQHIDEILLQMNFGNAIQDYNIFKKIQQNCKNNQFMSEGGDVDPLLKQQTNSIEELWNEFKNYEQTRKIKIKRQPSTIKSEQIDEEHTNHNEQKAGQIKQQINVQTKQAILQTNQSKNLELAIEQPTQTYKQTQKTPICESSQANINAIISQIHSNEKSSDIQQSSKSVQKPRRQIASFIHMKKNQLSVSTDIVLKQITDFETDEPNEHLDLVKRWRNLEKKKVVRRVKKQKSPLAQYVQFLDDGKQRSRSSIFSIDKSKRKEVKKLMKSLHLMEYDDFNSLIDTSRWKIDLKVMTSLRQHTISTIVINSTVNQSRQNEMQANQVNLDHIIDLTAPISLSDQQIDCYRKNMNISIRKAKDIIRDIMFAEQQPITFLDVYEKLVKIEGSISPALCFLTVLHLTNQHCLILQNCQNQYNFTIHRQ